MSKIWRLLVVGIITALTGIIIGCSASAAEYVQVRVGRNPSGTVISGNLSDIEPKSGLTGFELIRNSIYEDISYGMDFWMNSIDKNTASANASWGTSVIYSAIADDAEKRGVLPYSNDVNVVPEASLSTEKRVSLVAPTRRYYPGLSMPSLAWASYFESSTLFSSSSTARADGLIWGNNYSSDLDKEARYLIFTSGTAVYSYPLCDTVYADSKFQKEFVQIMQVALFDAFTPYASVIYTYSNSDAYVLRSASSLCLDENLTPAYIIHPLVGIIPCNGRYASDDKDYLIQSRADYFAVFYGYRYSDNATASPLGLSKILGETSSKNISNKYDVSNYTYKSYTNKIHLLVKEYISASQSVKSSTSLANLFNNSTSKNSAYARYAEYLTSDINCYFWGTQFVSDAFMDEQAKKTSIHAFIISPDYIQWVYKVRSTDTRNSLVGLYGVDASKVKSSVLSSISMSKMKSTTVSLSPTRYIYSLTPLAGITQWKPTNVFGVYTDTLQEGNPNSLLSIWINEGLSSMEYVDTKSKGLDVGYGYTYLYGSSKGYSYSSNVSEDLTLEDGSSINVEMANFNCPYYVDILTGKLYKPTTDAFGLLGVCDVKARPNASVGLSSAYSFAMQGLGMTYVSADDVYVSNLYVAKAKGVSPRKNYGSGIFINDSTKERYCVGDTWINVAVSGSYSECIQDEWKDKRTTTTGKTSESSIVFYLGTGRTVTFNLDNAKSIDLISTNGTVKYTNTDTEASGSYYNIDGRISTANPSELKYKIIILNEEPAIVLGSSYVQDSSVLDWLETNAASSYMSKYVAKTGYTADLLYKRLTSQGVTINSSASLDDYQRYEDISLELEGDNSNSIIQTVLTAISFVGLLLMVYACALVIAFYIDIFNTVSSISILNIITFGACKAVQSKQDLEYMGITDRKEQRKYCTRLTIMYRWAGAMLLGILFFASNKVYILVLRLYTWLMQLF